MKPVQGEPSGEVRPCCLNYSQDHPQLLVYRGLGIGIKPLGDMWILDVDTGKWTEVSFVLLYVCVLSVCVAIDCLRIN